MTARQAQVARCHEAADAAARDNVWDRCIAAFQNLDRIEREIAEARLSMARDVAALVNAPVQEGE